MPMVDLTAQLRRTGSRGNTWPGQIYLDNGILSCGDFEIAFHNGPLSDTRGPSLRPTNSQDVEEIPAGAQA